MQTYIYKIRGNLYKLNTLDTSIWIKYNTILEITYIFIFVNQALAVLIAFEFRNLHTNTCQLIILFLSPQY